MRAADTSVVVAAFSSWHANHDAARRALDNGLRLIEHCALETFSVLTRLPPPHRIAGDVVLEFLAQRFPGAMLRMSETAYRTFVLGLVDQGITGGAAYDALIAATAAHCKAEIVSCDRRAIAIYDRYGVRVHLLS